MKKVLSIISLCIIFQFNASHYIPQTFPIKQYVPLAFIDLKKTTEDNVIGRLKVKYQLNSVLKGTLFQLAHQINIKFLGTATNIPFFALLAFECFDTIKHPKSSPLLAKVIGHSIVFFLAGRLKSIKQGN